jgi:hypothetical protein
METFSPVNFPGPDRWVFRGLPNSEWRLETSLERALRRLNPGKLTAVEAEENLLRECKRHIHRYSKYVPIEDDRLEWLALMQHHGAPTRMLDWTYSQYVALYFAVEDVKEEKPESAIWVVNQSECWRRFKAKLPECRKIMLEKKNDKDRQTLNWVLTRFHEPIMCPLNPFHQNARLSAQQGTFLVPLDPSRNFKEHFDNTLENDPMLCRKIKITCTEAFLREVAAGLQRVNVTAVSLFPGVDGFHRSLRNMISLPHFLPQR